MTTEAENSLDTAVEGESKEDKILNILSAGKMRCSGSFQVAQLLRSGARRPLPEGHTLKVGDDAIVTPITRSYPSGGSVTTYKITPKGE